MERAQNEAQHFTNEIVMNEYTIREILSGIWTYKAVRNRWPVVIYLLVIFALFICTLVTGNEIYIFLLAVVGLVGLAFLLIYAGIYAYSGAKKREKKLQQTLEKYGQEAVLKIDIDENISYHFSNIEKTITYQEIKKVIELDMYLILQLKNGLELPIWKIGFTHGEWDDFIPYFKQKTGKK